MIPMTVMSEEEATTEAGDEGVAFERTDMEPFTDTRYGVYLLNSALYICEDSSNSETFCLSGTIPRTMIILRAGRGASTRTRE